jgi:hypothetical protein
LKEEISIFEKMAEGKTVKFLLPFLKEGKLFSLFKEYEEGSYSSITVIKCFSLYKLPLFLENKDFFLEKECLDYHTEFKSEYFYNLKDNYHSLNFIIIFEEIEEFDKLIKNLPDCCDYYINTVMWCVSECKRSAFTENVKNLLHPISIKPAKQK